MKEKEPWWYAIADDIYWWCVGSMFGQGMVALLGAEISIAVVTIMMVFVVAYLIWSVVRDLRGRGDV